MSVKAFMNKNTSVIPSLIINNHSNFIYSLHFIHLLTYWLRLKYIENDMKSLEIMLKS